jgi:hypothetical protein
MNFYYGRLSSDRRVQEHSQCGSMINEHRTERPRRWCTTVHTTLESCSQCGGDAAARPLRGLLRAAQARPSASKYRVRWLGTVLALIVVPVEVPAPMGCHQSHPFGVRNRLAMIGLSRLVEASGAQAVLQPPSTCRLRRLRRSLPVPSVLSSSGVSFITKKPSSGRSLIQIFMVRARCRALSGAFFG